MPSFDNYRSGSATLLGQAQIELETGDLIQASEKYWGATAQAFKAIAEERGWEHKSHAHLYRVLRNIVDETGDREITKLFNSANLLHINFYEHYMDREEMQPYIEDVSTLLDRLDDI